MKTAVISGNTGQDGAYLADLLLKKGYKVYGAIRQSADRTAWRLKSLGIHDKIEFITFAILPHHFFPPVSQNSPLEPRATVSNSEHNQER